MYAGSCPVPLLVSIPFCKWSAVLHVDEGVTNGSVECSGSALVEVILPSLVWNWH